MTETEPPTGAPRTSMGTLVARTVLIVVCLLIAAMWVYGFVFASKEARNKIGDRAWAERAEEICAEAQRERLELVDLRRIDEVGEGALAERADLVDRATDIVEAMLDAVVAVAPADAKGQDLVPQWEADYRTYLGDRRDYADLLRSGINRPFAETRAENIPISERLETFAGDNEMPACAPPRDLVA